MRDLGTSNFRRGARWLYRDVDGSASLGLLVVRVAMGAAFLFHGWPKIQQPMDWMGPDTPVPGVFQLLAAVAEFGGGAALIVGLLSRLACLGIACNMIVALAMVHLPAGHAFVGKPGQPSFELAAVYLACAILLLLTGPGRWSLDRVALGRFA